MNAIDNLIEKIKETNNPTVIGLDPRYDMIPEVVRNKYSNDLEGISKAILEYNKELIDNTYDIIPAIKPQLAFYEMFGIEGMKAFKETCKYAKEKIVSKSKNSPFIDKELKGKVKYTIVNGKVVYPFKK